LIVKIHGAVDRSSGDYRWKENYVITEDHYIDYLSRSPIESLVPVQILDKLRDSHVLFLGYTVREWNLRVFLQRIWRGEPLGARSWAIEPEPDALEKEFWAHSNVDLYAAGLPEYVRRLEGRLDGLAQPSAWRHRHCGIPQRWRAVRRADVHARERGALWPQHRADDLISNLVLHG
jgi:hypothetical protein